MFLSTQHLTHFFPMQLDPRGGGHVSIIFGGHSVEAYLPSQGSWEVCPPTETNMGESPGTFPSSTNSDVIMKLFVYVYRGMHTHSDTHADRQTQAHATHRETCRHEKPCRPTWKYEERQTHGNSQTHMEGNIKMHRRVETHMKTSRLMETCRHVQTGTHSKHSMYLVPKDLRTAYEVHKISLKENGRKNSNVT